MTLTRYAETRLSSAGLLRHGHPIMAMGGDATNAIEDLSSTSRHSAYSECDDFSFRFTNCWRA